jgi:hypothetical protein
MILIIGPVVSPRAAAPRPKNSANTTICNISLFERAAKTEVGTRWVTNSLRFNDAVFRLLEALASGSGKPRLSPGRRTETMISPRVRDSKEAVRNQPMVFKPTRPTVFESPMCAMPTTSVEKTNGAMIILISLKNRSVTSER